LEIITSRVPALLAIFSLAASGCFSYPLGGAGAIDTGAQQQLSSEVPLYDSSHLPSGNFIKVGMITAFGCDNRFLGGPGRDEVIAKLRQQAQSMGANGITDLSCDPTDAGSVRGCISATACSATALRVFPSATKGD